MHTTPHFATSKAPLHLRSLWPMLATQADTFLYLCKSICFRSLGFKTNLGHLLVSVWSHLISIRWASQRTKPSLEARATVECIYSNDRSM